MFRIVLYAIVGALLGFFAAVLVAAFIAPAPTSEGYPQMITVVLFFGTIVVCMILGVVFARFINSRDKGAGTVDYSKIPPPALASIIIAMWMEGVALLGGIAVAVAFNVTSFDTVGMFVAMALLLCVGAICGVWHVRYLKLNLSAASTDQIALSSCFLYIIGVLINSWGAVLANPLVVVGTLLVLLPAYLFVRHMIKRS